MLVAGAVGSFVNTAATSSPGVLLTLHLQGEQGLSAARAGAVLVALSLAVVPGSALAAVLVRRTSLRAAIALGLGLLASGNVLAATQLDSLVGTVAALVVLGVGLGISSVGCNDLGTAVPDHLVPAATGVLNTSAQLGTAVGVAATVLVASAGQVGGVPGVAVALGLVAVTALAASGLGGPGVGQEALRARTVVGAGTARSATLDRLREGGADAVRAVEHGGEVLHDRDVPVEESLPHTHVGPL